MGFLAKVRRIILRYDRRELLRAGWGFQLLHPATAICPDIADASSLRSNKQLPSWLIIDGQRAKKFPMSITVPKSVLILACAAFLALRGFSFGQAPAPTRPAGSHERADLKVLKVFAAKDGEAVFRAYLVEWKGQEVVAEDRLVKTKYQVGDTIAVLVMRAPFPQGKEPYDLLHFSVLPPPR